MKLNPYWIAIRPKTLVLGSLPVLIGSLVALQNGKFSVIVFLLALVFSLFIQIGCNLINDYFDFKLGADNSKRLGPKRAIASGILQKEEVLYAAKIILFLALFSGLPLIIYGGWILLPIGLLCIFCSIWYTAGKYSLAYLGLGEVFVFLFFGLVGVMTTFYTHTGNLSLETFWWGSLIGFLSVSLVLINNYRDVDTDRKVSKKTVVVRFGKTFAEQLYILTWSIASLILVVLCIDYNYSVLIFAPWLVFSRWIAILKKLKIARTKVQFTEVFNLNVKQILRFSILLLPSLILG